MTKPPRDAAFLVLLRREVVRVLVDAGKEAGGWEDCCSCCSAGGTGISRPVVVHRGGWWDGLDQDKGQRQTALSVQQHGWPAKPRQHTLCFG